MGYCLLGVEVDLSKYNDAKPSDKSDDEGQPPYILKKPQLFFKWCGMIRIVGPFFFNIY
jgi:hypothetical protein